MEKFITKSERNLDRYANSLNNYILRGGQITDIHIEELKSMLNLYNLELDKIHKKTALSTKELSIVFGFSISWITKMTSKKLIPFYKNSNGHCVFIRKDFEEWLSNPEILEIKFKEYENEKIIIETFIPDEVCEVLQDEFIEKALLKLSLTSKELYSLEECSEFLNISPKYVYQLVHAKKLKTSKKDGQKKHVFKKADLIDYLLNEDDKSTNEFEDDVVNGWNKKSK